MNEDFDNILCDVCFSKENHGRFLFQVQRRQMPPDTSDDIHYLWRLPRQNDIRNFDLDLFRSRW